jgi:hypothetical protein
MLFVDACADSHEAQGAWTAMPGVGQCVRSK